MAAMTDNQIISKLKKGVMGNDPEYLHRSLWRQAEGNRDKAFFIIRATASHYGLKAEEIKDYHIDCALGELNGGTEVEWLDPEEMARPLEE